MKRVWNLDPVHQIVQKILEKYCPFLYLLIHLVWWVNDLWFKTHSKMHPASSTNTHHDVTDLGNHGMVKNTKTWISWERNETFLRNKKNLSLCLRWHILEAFIKLFFTLTQLLEMQGREGSSVLTHASKVTL